MSRITKDLVKSAHHPQLDGSGSTMQTLHRASGKVPEIAIIGAGISGLRCADTLISSGAKVTIFEARDRVGGRLHQQESGGFLMDMGPNWIHGTHKNPIMKLAEQTKTAVMEPEEENIIFDSKGDKKTIEESNELSAKMWGLIVDAFKHSDEHSSSIDPAISLHDYFNQRLSSEIGDRRKLQDALNESRMWGPFVGDSIERQSLKFFFLEECIEGENVFVASTYRSILDEISRTALNASIIRFDTEVTKITLHSDEELNTEVRITTSRSPSERYDEVIVTCPLGWLKQYHSQVFRPALPPRLTQAISSISYGRLEKVYVTFPSAFWLSDGDKSTHPVFTHFHPPASHPAAPSSAKLADWNQSVISLAHLPPLVSHPTLLFYIYGDCATHVVSSVVRLQPHCPEYNAKLTDFTEPFYSKLPNYSKSNLDCTPTSFLATTWQADKFAGNGSYCNFQVGLTHADEDIESMRDAGGLTEKGLWLAGEHTAPFVALGTTTGAWWSGEAVARRVCQKYGLKVPDKDLDQMNGQVKDVEAKHERPDAAQMNGLAL